MKFLINLKKHFESKYSEDNIDSYPELTIENIRRRFEQFLEIWGLDFNSSSGLWDLYLAFENSNLEKFKREHDQSSISQSINLIRSIYRRRISFPHIDLDIIWREYKKWETNPEEIEKVEIKFHEVNKCILNSLFY
jgi:hypothetical protein